MTKGAGVSVKWETQYLSWRLLAAILILGITLNALVYTIYATNPVLASDYWYFLEAFVRKMQGGSLNLLDFWVKRGGLDHAQPLAKLILYANVRWMGLDLTFDALIGFGFAVVCIALLGRTLFQPEESPQARAFQALSFVALAACALTLNAGSIYTYALVTLAFMVYALIITTALMAWRYLTGGPLWPALLALLVLDLTADDSALLCILAVTIACALFAVKTGHFRRAFTLSGLALAMDAVYLVCYELFIQRGGETAAVLNLSFSQHIKGLVEHGDQWLAFVAIPLTSTLAHVTQIVYWTGHYALPVTWMLFTLALVLHGLFWYRALRGKLDRSAFCAVVIMLLFYAYVAGIMYGRVGTFGATYFNQPRYEVFYLLANVAIVLMAASEFRNPTTTGKGGPLTAVVVTGGLLLLQVMLVRLTWYEGFFVNQYNHKMAQQLLHLPEQSEQVTVQCVPLLVVCGYDQAKRVKAVEYLRQHQLNVFSPGFRQRHDIP